MLTKLTRDRRFKLSLMQLNRPPATQGTQTGPADFVAVNDRRCKLRHGRPNPPYPNACPVEMGTHTEVERNFLWLPWVPGKVSYAVVTAGGLPILTGEMTGCWLVLFTLNGQTCFGHIGTEAFQTHENSLKAKNAWKVAVGRGIVQPLKAFNPVNYGLPAQKTLAGVSADQNFYTIRCDVEGGAYKVVATTRVQGAPLAPPQMF